MQVVTRTCRLKLAQGTYTDDLPAIVQRFSGILLAWVELNRLLSTYHFTKTLHHLVHPRKLRGKCVRWRSGDNLEMTLHDSHYNFYNYVTQLLWVPATFYDYIYVTS